MTFWTEDRERRLASLVDKGFSSSQIGAALGCSRNAVLGKVHRGKGRLGVLPSPVAKRAKAARARPVPVARPKPSPPPAEPQPDNPPMPFLDALFADACLWGVGDSSGARGPAMPVCGAPRADIVGTRWCAHHLRRAFAPRAA